MFKVFLVEDEIVVREGIRKNIQWEQYGFSYAGDAPDGELALPLRIWNRVAIYSSATA